MKKWLILVLQAQFVCGMYSKIASHDNFGKKHFIVGYKSAQPDNKVTKKENVVTKKDKSVPSTQSYFTSVHDVRKELNACLKNAHKSICIASFALTDSQIADQLIQAHQNNIAVTIVTDKEKMRERHSKIGKLVNHGIPVYYYNCSLNPNARQKRAKNALMHHKFIVIDNETLVFGSLNLTKTGQEENMENITITTKAKMVADYQDEFARLLSFSTQVTSPFIFT